MHIFVEDRPYIGDMPKKSRLTPSLAEKETLGRNLARIRKERGVTQVELAQRTGLIQVIVSDYERGRLRLPADMAVRFAEALGVTTDELLRTKKGSSAKPGKQPSLKLVRRMEQIEDLPLYQQRALLTTIDAFLENRAAG